MTNIFGVFDQTGSDKVDIAELKTILTALDMKTDDDQLEEFEKLVDPEETGFFNYAALRNVVNKAQNDDGGTLKKMQALLQKQ